MSMRWFRLWMISLIATALAASPTSKPADPFTVDSHWTGTEAGDQRRPNTPQARSRAAAVTVTDRKDASFAADYVVGSSALHLEGKVDGNGTIVAHATRVTRGNDWDPHILDLIWSGNVSATRLTLSYANSKNLERTVNLTLDESGGGEKHRRKK